MKKLFITIALVFCCTFGLFAQKAFPEASVTYVNVPIIKVLEHVDAYVIVYINNSNKVTYVSAPKIWFKQNSPEKKGVVRALPKKLAPYMTICFKDGEFSFLKLTMPVSKMDSAWGIIPSGKALPPEMDPKKVAAGF